MGSTLFSAKLKLCGGAWQDLSSKELERTVVALPARSVAVRFQA